MRCGNDSGNLNDAINITETTRAPLVITTSSPKIVRMTCQLSSLTVELSSALALSRITRTCCGWPELANTAAMPLVRANVVTSTATVSAIPTAVMIVVPLRSKRFRML